MSTIVFDEVSAEIAPPVDAGPPAGGGAAADAAPAAAAPGAAVEQLRLALALLHAREARLAAD